MRMAGDVLHCITGDIATPCPRNRARRRRLPAAAQVITGQAMPRGKLEMAPDTVGGTGHQGRRMAASWAVERRRGSQVSGAMRGGWRRETAVFTGQSRESGEWSSPVRSLHGAAAVTASAAARVFHRQRRGELVGSSLDRKSVV